ncbi:DNA repair protein RecO [Crocinitomix algicola]|uniref:DNA repair protein RecO n=1 Tax=Crocinitomix algicola TaxID=1740263 RepID=UPI00082F7074|nr:DNA repair protein RecO [Crocinitomix algicola]
MATHKIQGIVLRKTDYSETSIILQVLTAEEGIKSFIYQGGKRKNKKGNLISPLAVIDIEYYQRKESELGRISSLGASIIYKSIPFDPYKSSIVFFMNEVLSATVQEHEENESLFHFLLNILSVLDLSETIANFPIKFLYRLTQYIGFYPNEVERPTYLDLKEGTYTPYAPSHGIYLSQENTALLLTLSKCSFDGENDPPVNLGARREIMNDLVRYYQLVIENFKPLKSLPVLEATFHN